jgi:hypothetical protein
MRNDLVREGGKRWTLVSDRGDRGLFVFKFCSRLFFDVFPFPQNYQTISRTIGQRAAICSVRAYPF